jgi:hypothetical protein
MIGKCETCGNTYDDPFEIRKGGKSMIFDSFECAIHALAPACSHCGCRVIGHGVQDGATIFCGAYCARLGGVTGVGDRAHPPTAVENR